MQQILYVWFVVVAGPQGGLAVVPGGFESRDQCAAAIAEYHSSAATKDWKLECVPGGTAFTDEMPPDDMPPAEQ
ncbi:MAG: hypothetical protein JNM20_03765 [Rhizobiales bacterium]|nr:hypothetical protein [Hyphomicrobiales bacterium]